jgi:hypothetical protein
MKINRREFLELGSISAISLLSSCPINPDSNLSQLELKTKFYELMTALWELFCPDLRI